MNSLRRMLIPSAAVLALAAISSAESPKDPGLHPPVRLKAGDAYIDTKDYIAHTGPLLHDYDGDGRTDLLVGNFAGHIQLFRNTGTREAPVYEAKGLLQADEKDVKIPNW